MLWISLLTWFKGSLIGQDSFGNKYYEIKGPEATNMRRWVVYKGSPEASKVPAEWHGWLHHQALTPPSSGAKRWPWEKKHLPNLSGTAYGYHPSDSYNTTKRTLKSYEIWEP